LQLDLDLLGRPVREVDEAPLEPVVEGGDVLGHLRLGLAQLDHHRLVHLRLLLHERLERGAHAAGGDLGELRRREAAERRRRLLALRLEVGVQLLELLEQRLALRRLHHLLRVEQRLEGRERLLMVRVRVRVRVTVRVRARVRVRASVRVRVRVRVRVSERLLMPQPAPLEQPHLPQRAVLLLAQHLRPPHARHELRVHLGDIPEI